MEEHRVPEPGSEARKATQAAYDRLSRWYDLLAGGSERALREEGAGRLAVSAGERVLELGFGTGQTLADLGRAAGLTGGAIGVDLSPGMCRVARRRAQRAGCADRVLLVCGDASRLPVAAGSVDAIFMSFTLEFFADGEIRGVLAECRRALRREGRLCVVAMAEASRPNLMSRLYGWAHRRFPTYVDCRPIPAAATLASHGFHVIETARRAVAGLPVEVVVARKNALFD